MELPIYQIDAFTTRLFGGNPAAVCPLDAWLPEATMQAIAAENNLSETAFFVREGNGVRIRWFTPRCEVKLCGHATLAAAWVWFRHIEPQATEVVFDSLSGLLKVTRAGERLTLDFPAQISAPLPTPVNLVDALGITPLECRSAGEDWLVVVDSAATVRTLQPRFEAIRQLDCRGLAVTARGDDCDFVSRFFAPKVGIDEDPVTGSAHTKLVPYWSDQLGKLKLHAHQLSQRGGELFCELRWERVLMSGTAVPYLAGTISLDGTAWGMQ
ncbi:MAG TPA: PhzF family phenazine biosynthesis protein [Gammaproteobacteria bacterium]